MKLFGKYVIGLSTALVIASTVPVGAAEEWGIEFEKKARYEAKVVDVLCEVTGNCAANCGGGKRQLGLLKDDGTLLLVVKNNDPFAGAVNDLIRHCGKRVVADGLHIKNPKMHLFQLQFSRLAPDGKWSGAKQFSKDWATANNKKNAKGWFRQDKRIKAILAKDGVLGIPGLKPPKN